MNEEQKALIVLVKSALDGEKRSIPENADLSRLCDMAHRHAVLPMFYYGALVCGIDKNLPEMQRAFRVTCQLILLGEQQKTAFSELFERLEKEQIPYLPLKGIHLKDLYPKVEMRAMSDGDILIHEEDYPRIAPVMKELGYAPVVESDHEYVWQRGQVHIELHRRLIPSYNKDYYAYFKDGWNHARQIEGRWEYRMTPEDEFVYLFIHFAKHYRDSGIGIKHLTDLFVYRRAIPLSEELVREKLEALQVLDFYDNVMKTLSFWFEDAKGDDKTRFISSFIFFSGVYGTFQTQLLSQSLKKSRAKKGVNGARFHMLFRAVFPPLKQMVGHYPVLARAAFLLPVFWIWRLMTRLFSKRKWKSFATHYDALNQEDISEYEQALRYVGLDFRFEET